MHRYYSYIRGGNPDPEQVEAIVQFARGLPMVATTVVQLWVKYGAEDFQAVRPQVVADLADRLLEGVPQETRPAFEAAAVLRYFNVEVLGALLEGGNAEGMYAELRHWPFVRSRREGLAIHDTMREMINEALRVRTPGRFQKLHERAAVYYETRLGKQPERSASVTQQSDCIIVYMPYLKQRCATLPGNSRGTHALPTKLFLSTAERREYLPVEQENSRLWRKYYNARLAHMEARISLAEEIYRAIGEQTRRPKVAGVRVVRLGWSIVSQRTPAPARHRRKSHQCSRIKSQHRSLNRCETCHELGLLERHLHGQCQLGKGSVLS